MPSKPDGKPHCSVTVSGRSCQYWSLTSPHKPRHRPKQTNHNRCSNPSNDPNGEWCYTTDANIRWEYCNCTRPEELNELINKNLEDNKIRSIQIRSNTGHECLYWNSQDVLKVRPVINFWRFQPDKRKDRNF